MAEVKTYTQAGFDALQKELDYLVNVRVEENKKEISTARAFGDLSENSEYDEAKQEQAKIHSRIDELREMIANAKVVDESQIDESKISVGSIVVVKCDKLGEKTYHIVGSYETDPKNGKISDASPIGLALIGAREGDTVIANVAKGALSLKVVKVTRAKD
ncbi:MAG: transcription elongation factor GreA [Clostridia bacterium]|nr:transcription elongation factor GreA [Clostridia bacterium]